MTDRTHQDLHDRIAKIEAQLAPKAPNLPPVQFKQVADGIDVGYDIFGGVDIRIGGDFVYVHINYDHRYTDNASRKLLADQIVGLLTAQPAPSGDVRERMMARFCVMAAVRGSSLQMYRRATWPLHLKTGQPCAVSRTAWPRCC